MGSAKMLNRIQGSWIWKQSLLGSADGFLLMRKEFACPFVGQEATLWISASCTYTLYLNGRFIGFGPHPHPNRGISYYDAHDITFYLESGINVIAIIVYCNQAYGMGKYRTPGLWCQLEAQDRVVIKSDDSWLVREGDGFTQPRAKTCHDGAPSWAINAPESPPNWMGSVFTTDAAWGRPDYIMPVGGSGTALVPYPTFPPNASSDAPMLRPDRRGRITNEPNWSQVGFKMVAHDDEVFAAEGFLRSPAEKTATIKVFSDDPFRLFVNGRLICEGQFTPGSEHQLQLQSGWNRFLAIQKPTLHAMGIFILLPDSDPDTGFQPKIYQDCAGSNHEGWSIAGPLMLEFGEVTPALDFDRLRTSCCAQDIRYLNDPDSWLAACTVVDTQVNSEKELTRPLAKGDFIVYRLDSIRYGMPRINFDAAFGDQIDVVVGCRVAPDGHILPDEAKRATSTIRCRNGRNCYMECYPKVCQYVMFAVRRAAGVVKIVSAEFDELVRLEQNENQFHCSDELLNKFWRIGRMTERRLTAFMPLSERHPDNDCYLLDAYVDAVNNNAVSGDSEYSEARLMQFFEFQLEDGGIPALSGSDRHSQQLLHLFFMPVWMHYNYRVGQNIKALRRQMPQFEMLSLYFENMIDREKMLLPDVEGALQLRSRFSTGKFQPGDNPTYLNALYCRFLLSAATLYQIAGQDSKAKHCLELASRVSEALIASNYDPEAQLFCRKQRVSGGENEHNLLANFCALLGGVLPQESFEHFFYSFFNYDPPFDRSPEAEHPYFNFLFTEMMFAQGDREWAFGYFRDYWSRRLCSDIEAWRVDPEQDIPAPIKFSDGSCLCPNVFLLREVLGVKVADDTNGAIVFFNPAFEFVDSADGMLTIPSGRIKAKWEILPDGVLDVTLDSSCDVKIMPELSPSRIANTIFRLGEKVTLLDPGETFAYKDDAGEEPPLP